MWTFLGILPVEGSAGKGSYTCLRESSQKNLNIHTQSQCNVSNMWEKQIENSQKWNVYNTSCNLWTHSLNLVVSNTAKISFGSTENFYFN
jgi:hypothetical protein